jgi:hypothetical protein
LAVLFVIEVLTGARDACLAMELAQLGHTCMESGHEVIDFAGTKIDVLE